MGITEHGAKFYIDSYARGVDFRRTLTIGRQNLYATAEDVDSFFGEYGITPKQPYERFGSTEFAEPFLQMLGAESIDAIDASDYEGANLIHDLNKPLPAEWHSRYSAVIEGGTIEHVFQLPQAIKSLMQLVKVGGHLLMESPANNFCGHGFYQLSPEFFYRVLSESNGFVLERMILFEYVRRGRWFEVADPASILDRIEVHIPMRQTGLLVRAKRIADKAILESNPTQSDYQAAWIDHDRKSGSHHSSDISTGQSSIRKSIVKKLERLLPFIVRHRREQKHERSMRKLLPSAQPRKLLQVFK